MTHSIWIARCDLTKKREREAEYEHQQLTRQAQIHTIYNTTHDEDLLPADRYLLELSATERIQTTTVTDQELWIQSIGWAKDTATDERASENTELRTTMDQWLGR